MYMASIWELYGFNGQFLQPTYTGLTRDIYYGTYNGHISKSISNVTLVKASDEVQHVKKKLKI